MAPGCLPMAVAAVAAARSLRLPAEVAVAVVLAALAALAQPLAVLVGFLLLPQMALAGRGLPGLLPYPLPEMLMKVAALVLE